MALHEAAFAEAFNDNGEADDRCIAVLEKTFRELAVPRFLFWPNPYATPHRYFGDEGLLIADHAGTWLWVVALSQDALDRVRRVIPCGWIMHSTE